MSTEKLYKIIWTQDSPTPGRIEELSFLESQLPVHNREEVLGEFRDYVEVVPGSQMYKLYVDQSTINSTETELLEVDLLATTYNWETTELNLVYLPELGWDNIRAARNTMLASSDNMFNIDTPDPLKSEWIEYRQLLRDMIKREIDAGNTPTTVEWYHYVPPFPASARIGVPDDKKALAVWYKAENTYPPAAIIGSVESNAAAEEAAKITGSS